MAGAGDRFSVDSGMVVVIFISLGYLVLVFGLLFYVKNDWCDLLFKNMTVVLCQNKCKVIFYLELSFVCMSLDFGYAISGHHCFRSFFILGLFKTVLDCIELKSKVKES